MPLRHDVERMCFLSHVQKGRNPEEKDSEEVDSNDRRSGAASDIDSPDSSDPSDGESSEESRDSDELVAGITIFLAFFYIRKNCYFSRLKQRTLSKLHKLAAQEAEDEVGEEVAMAAELLQRLYLMLQNQNHEEIY